MKAKPTPLPALLLGVVVAVGARRSGGFPAASSGGSISTRACSHAAYGGVKMQDLIRAVRQTVAVRDAQPMIYGLTPISIEVKFTAWVKRSDPRREKPRRRI